MDQQATETTKLSFTDDLPLAHLPSQGFRALLQQGPESKKRRVKSNSCPAGMLFVTKDDSDTTNEKSDEDDDNNKNDDDVVEVEVDDARIPKNGDDDDSMISMNIDKGGLGWGRGIVQDFQRTIGTWWCAEMTNLNTRTFAVTLFLFFACVAPAITFGALYSKVRFVC